jgi:uncharacterized membrane protein YhaH (DUF805 family)
MNWYLEVLKKYATFDGRARRKEYWMFTLINFLIMIGLMIVMGIAGQDNPQIIGILGMILNLYGLAVFLPGLAVTFRRLHDTNRSGWFWLLGFIPIIGAIILIVFLAQDGDASENQYGSKTKLVTA